MIRRGPRHNLEISGLVLSEGVVQDSSGEYVAFSGHGQNLHGTIVHSITLPNYLFENLPSGFVTIKAILYTPCCCR